MLINEEQKNNYDIKVINANLIAKDDENSKYTLTVRNVAIFAEDISHISSNICYVKENANANNSLFYGN